MAPAPLASSSGPMIPYFPAPGSGGSMPIWVWQLFGGLVTLYVLASLVGNLWPKSRVGAALLRWVADVRNLAARAPAAPAASPKAEPPSQAPVTQPEAGKGNSSS